MTATSYSSTDYPAISSGKVLAGIGKPMWRSTPTSAWSYFNNAENSHIIQRVKYAPVVFYEEDSKKGDSKYIDNTKLKGWARLYELEFFTSNWKTFRDTFYPSLVDGFQYRPHSDNATYFDVFINSPLVNNINKHVDVFVINMTIQGVTIIATLPYGWTAGGTP